MLKYKAEKKIGCDIGIYTVDGPGPVCIEFQVMADTEIGSISAFGKKESDALDNLIRACEYQRRKFVLKRDGYKCRNCGSVGVGLDVHHKEFRSHQGRPYVDNLISLCHDCHELLHKNKSMASAIGGI